MVRMSATLPPGQPSSEPHGIEEEDWQHPVAGPRLGARKVARLHEVAKPGAKALAEELARRARETATRPGVNVVGVVANRVAVARATFEQLRRPAKGKGGEPSLAILLTGRIRPFDRDVLLAEHLGAMSVERRRKEARGTLFVVATQAVEVGANLDFDALVTECAPLDALRQRLGRLDRRGELGKTHVDVVHAPGFDGEVDEKGKVKKADALYGEANPLTWRWLREAACEPELDLGTSGARPPADRLSSLCFARPHAPVLLPAHVDAWMRTSPTPVPDPPVAPFLHGLGAVQDDVHVAWRADLPEDDRAAWEKCVVAAPLRPLELLSVPLGAVRSWLRRKPDASAEEVADLEGTGRTEATDPGAGGRPVVRVLAADRAEVVEDPSELRPGDTIVCPSGYGGCDEFGWAPAHDGAVVDVADFDPDHPRRARLRLAARPLVSALGLGPEDAAAAEVERLLASLRVAGRAPGAGPDEPDEPDDLSDRVGVALQELRCVAEGLHTPGSRALGQVLQRLTGGGAPRVVETPLWYVVQERRQPEVTDNDSEDSSFTGRRVGLDEHGASVGTRARTLARNVGVDEALANTVASAGEGHDLGKAERRFQCWLYDGDELAMLASARLLAKSGLDYRSPSSGAAKRSAGVPPGFEHEAVSAALVRQLFDDHWPRADADLVTYLVGSHHGSGRPCFRPLGEPLSSDVRVRFSGVDLNVGADALQSRLDDRWVRQFFALNARYGPWGLAFLEVLVRQADVWVSRREQEGH